MSEANPIAAVRQAWEAAGLDDGSLQALRNDALAVFEQSGIPSARLENWKYTDTRELGEKLPVWLSHPVTAADTPEQPELEVSDAINVTIVDGIYAADLSDAGELPSGAVLADIAELAATHPETLQRMGTLANDAGLVALNSAFAGNGTALVVPDDAHLEKPLVITYLSSQAESVAQPRLLVQIGSHASATVIEHFAAASESIVNPVAELFCERGAQLTYYRLQNDAHSVWHTGAQYAALEQDALLRATAVDVGGKLVRNELTINLQGRGAHAEAKGLFMADGKRHADSRLNVNHIAPDTTSRERYRGIMADQARGVFNGRIYVHHDAQKTAADLTNRNLLLSKGAEINTKPELEIYADDVKCAHGSTTGQLDANSLFYLLTRGVDMATARNMLITAFAAELLTDISVPAIAECAQAALESLGDDDTGSSKA